MKICLKKRILAAGNARINYNYLTIGSSGREKGFLAVENVLSKSHLKKVIIIRTIKILFLYSKNKDLYLQKKWDKMFSLKM